MPASIESVFRDLEVRGEGGLICYITGGDPTPKYTYRILEVLSESGADLIEIGLPFSDPIADGPIIQEANTRALKAGVTTQTIFDIAKDTKKKIDIPIIILTYFNPIFKMGLQRFIEEARRHKIDGLIIPDLPIEEAEEYHHTAEKEGIDTIFLATPSTSKDRLTEILDYTSGFLYLVSLFGVTGTRDFINPLTIQSIKRIHRHTAGKPPLAVGFGISHPSHVKSVIDSGSEAAIVGSAFVKTIEDNLKDPNSILKDICTLTKNLKAATKKNY